MSISYIALEYHAGMLRLGSERGIARFGLRLRSLPQGGLKRLALRSFTSWVLDHGILPEGARTDHKAECTLCGDAAPNMVETIDARIVSLGIIP